MKLYKILKNINYNCYDKKLLLKDVKSIKINDKLIEEGDVFIALKGISFDGNNFIESAKLKGAICAISDQKCGDIEVEDARKCFALASKNFFNKACDRLHLIAVTGTNGKTTTANLIAKILNAAGLKTGIIGTLGAEINGKKIDTGFTTPDPFELHKIFYEMLKEGASYVVMEASAHALALKKLEGINFDIAILTNITEDHLDFFKDMNFYTKTKLSIFDMTKFGLCCDRNDGIKRLLKSNVKTYGFYDDDYKIDVLSSALTGSEILLKGEDFETKIQSKLFGKFNIENIVAAFITCQKIGLKTKQILSILQTINEVEGRMNIYKKRKNTVVIDYAHTPDGIEKVLSGIKEVCDNKIVIVFGCGGNRDKQKRPLMGEIAERLADEIILTSDNPRYEKPAEIINDIAGGIKDKNKYKIIENRQKAIEFALKNFQNDEIILIAGKGSEKYQEVAGVKYPLCDYDEIKKYE